MAYLKKHYQVMSLADFVEALATHRLPKKAVCFTFDDGYRQISTALLPIIRYFKIPITVFLVTNFINNQKIAWWEELRGAIINSEKLSVKFNKKNYSLSTREKKIAAYKKLCNYLKKLLENERQKTVVELIKLFNPKHEYFQNQIFLFADEIRALAKKGVKFGSHTISHPILSRISTEQATHEIRESKKILEKKLGIQINFFSYPNGRQEDFTDETREIVKKSHYIAALSLIQGACKSGDDLFQLKRVEIDESDSVPVLATKVSGLWGLLCGGYR